MALPARSINCHTIATRLLPVASSSPLPVVIVQEHSCVQTTTRLLYCPGMTRRESNAVYRLSPAPPVSPDRCWWVAHRVWLPVWQYAVDPTTVPDKPSECDEQRFSYRTIVPSASASAFPLQKIP